MRVFPEARCTLIDKRAKGAVWYVRRAQQLSRDRRETDSLGSSMSVRRLSHSHAGDDGTDPDAFENVNSAYDATYQREVEELSCLLSVGFGWWRRSC